MHDVFINGLGAYLPGDPVANRDMEDHIGRVGGVPCKYKSLILRQNRIKTRHYALDRAGAPTHSNCDMAARAIEDAIRKSEIVFYVRLPVRHGMARIDYDRVALRAPEIDRCRQTGYAAADDNYFARIRIVEVGVLDHGV